jgi:predicted transcriptional regulator of viral defense system
MRPALAAVAGRQSGLVTRTQAKALGYTERELRTLTKPLGEWHVVRRGVYVVRQAWSSAASHERHRLQVRAALLNARDPAIASHASGAILHGLAPLRVPEVVHLTRPGINGGRTDHGVSYHPAKVPSSDRTMVEGVAVTGPARTSLDVAREDGYLAGLVVADQVLRQGTTPAELERVVRGMKSWPHVTRARAVVHDADPRSESPGETLTRALVIELGAGTPEPQHDVVDGGRRARADLRLGWHLFEFDGRVKYARERPYDDARPGEDVLWAEKRREDWLRSLGYGVSRLVWADLMGPARDRTLRRLRDDVGRTVARVGETAWRRSLDGWS